MNIKDFDEYDTLSLGRLVARKMRYLDTLPAGNPQRPHLVQEINLLRDIYLRLAANTNWVCNSMNMEFTAALRGALGGDVAHRLNLNGFLFYWHLNDDYTVLNHERTPLIALHSNVAVHFPMMQIEHPEGDVFSALDIINTKTPARL